ncbi:MAG: hypothetical protein JRE21_00640 [Deltaproteobacteria bacterium]|jgi:hypothetical protein|nr:hypothetical protein [Deltaproteobacteria bacterium]
MMKKLAVAGFTFLQRLFRKLSFGDVFSGAQRAGNASILVMNVRVVPCNGSFLSIG